MAKSTLGRDYTSFYNGYVEALLFSTTDESDESGGEPLDKNYGADDFDRDAVLKMKRDCAKFYKAHRALISKEGLSFRRAGMCFWYERNGHGVGFDEEKISDSAMKTLGGASKKFGGVWPQVNGGKIYL